MRGALAGMGIGVGLVLGLQGCSLAPVRRGAGARRPDLEARGDDPDGSEFQEFQEFQDDIDPAAAGAGSEIVIQALANVGKPYRWGGATPEEGFDCSGLIAHVYDNALRLKLPRTSRLMSQRGARIDRKQLAAGDLVFFNTSRRAYSHVGIYIGRGRFVHAPSSGSVVRVERMDNRYWASRFNGARRLVATNHVTIR